MNQPLYTETFSRKVFRYLMLLSIVYWFFGSIKAWVLASDETIVFLDAVNGLTAFVLLILYRKGLNYQALATGYALYWCPMLYLYMVNMGGLDGPFSYAFFPIMIFTIILVENPMRLIVVVILAAIVILVALRFPLANQETVTIIPIFVNYIFVAFLISFLLGYMKRNYDLARYKIIEQNHEMNLLNENLDSKRRQLIDQKTLIVNIQNNLEILIKDRTQEQELKRVQLEEYAYDNAHIVRGPLTNILSLVELLEKEGNADIQSNLTQVKKAALELDQQVQRINEILR